MTRRSTSVQVAVAPRWIMQMHPHMFTPEGPWPNDKDDMA